MADLFTPGPQLPAPNAWVWTLAELLAYLEHHGAKIDIDTGSPRVTFPTHVPGDVRGRAIPHLKRLKGYVIDHYFGAGSVHAPKPQQIRDRMPLESRNGAVDGETARETRERILDAAKAKGRCTGLPVWLLLRTGLVVKPGHPPRECTVRKGREARKAKIAPEREATYVCVGSGAWEKLPKVTTRFEDEALEGARARAVRRKRRGE